MTESDVLIVGGGFSGLALAVQLLARNPARRIAIVEAGPHIGRGVAYGTDTDAHLLNVRVERMSFGATPSFGEFLAAIGRASPPDAFVPRRWFGLYAAEVARRLAAARPSLAYVRAGATSAEETSSGVRLVLDDGQVLAGRALVLAVGAWGEAPVAPRLIQPFAEGGLSCVGGEDTVAFLGTGLTMIDMVASLLEEGFSGRMIGVSRSGKLPTRHSLKGEWRFEPRRFADAGPAEVAARLRADVRAAARAGVRWQPVMDAFRPEVAPIWAGWTLAERSRFVRHAGSVWQHHRHRVPEAQADRLEALVASGRLVLRGGKILRVFADAAPARIVFAPRSGEGTEEIAADWLVDCRGLRLDLRAAGDSLLAGLARAGILAPDPLGLGLHTEKGALVSAEGAISNRFYALGPLTRGEHWETTGAPEVLGQAQILAARLENVLTVLSDNGNIARNEPN